MARFGERTRSGEAVSGFGKRPSAGGVAYGVATGGTSSSITVSSQNYTLLTFSSDGNLVVSQAGVFDLLLIGGGAGSNTSNGAYAGGGGGGVLGISSTLTVYLDAGTYAVDVGAGSGNGGPNGYKSSVAGYQVSGGGAGGGRGNNYMGDGNTNFIFRFPSKGANGGGSCISELNASGTLGYSGGYGPAAVNGSASSGGGGGGAGGNGGNASGGTGGTGGNGVDISGFTGAGSAYYAGAGAGGSPSGAAGLGGVAGNGGSGVNYGAGSANGTGAAGAVFVRFKV